MGDRAWNSLHCFSGMIKIDIVMLGVNSDLSGASPQFTLTCISTGGPATTVTWTRDSAPVVGEREIVLDDRLMATYTHTLTVTGRLPGEYTCTVANDRPSSDSESFTIEGFVLFGPLYMSFTHVQLSL